MTPPEDCLISSTQAAPHSHKHMVGVAALFRRDNTVWVRLLMHGGGPHITMLSPVGTSGTACPAVSALFFLLFRLTPQRFLLR